MPMPIYPALADAKVVFARGLQLPSNPDHVIFNAPRPLLGTQLSCTDWCHGRFYAQVNLADAYATAFVKQNIGLDARVVVTVTDEEVVEMLLIDNRYRDRYREFAFEQQLEMLLPNLSKIQSLQYGDALAMLDVAQAIIKASLSD